MCSIQAREMFAMAAMMIALLWLGLHPQPVLDLAQPVIDSLQKLAPDTAATLVVAPGGGGNNA